MTSNEKFLEALKFGQKGEKEVSEYLKNRGVIILPLYQFLTENKAPILEGQNMKIIAPDLTCFHSKKPPFFAEVKTKKRWIEFGGQSETGINLRHYKEYLELKKQTNISLYMFFLHIEKEPLGLYYCEIGTKLNRVWDGLNSKTGQRIEPEMALWNKKNLKKLY